MTGPTKTPGDPEACHHVTPTLAAAWHTALTTLLVLAPAIQSQIASRKDPSV